MKIVISGGLGYVGGRLSKYLAEQGHHVVALSRQAGALPNIEWPTNMHIAHPDDKHHLTGADVFIHLAALNENDCVKYPFKAIEVNITQTLDWLEHSYRAGIKRFIYFSTAHVYGRPLEGYYDENSITRPVHPYAITHKCAEDYVLGYCAEKGMSNTVIRMTNSFGAPAFPTANRWTLLVNDLCRTAVKKGKMVLLSDGLQSRDFICLADVCTALSHLLALSPANLSDIYNLGYGRSISVWEMAQLVHDTAERLLNRKISITRIIPAPNKLPPSLSVSITKLLNTGFKPENNIEYEIVSTLEYFGTLDKHLKS